MASPGDERLGADDREAPVDPAVVVEIDESREPAPRSLTATA